MSSFSRLSGTAQNHSGRDNDTEFPRVSLHSYSILRSVKVMCFIELAHCRPRLEEFPPVYLIYEWTDIMAHFIKVQFSVWQHITSQQTLFLSLSRNVFLTIVSYSFWYMLNLFLFLCYGTLACFVSCKFWSYFVCLLKYVKVIFSDYLLKLNLNFSATYDYNTSNWK